MGAWIEMKPEGAGQIRAWRADPAGNPRGGVVVIQEIFGVNAHIREVADRFAAEGYLAVAPAVFEHVEQGFDVGCDPASRSRLQLRPPRELRRAERCARLVAHARVFRQASGISVFGSSPAPSRRTFVGASRLAPHRLLLANASTRNRPPWRRPA